MGFPNPDQFDPDYIFRKTGQWSIIAINLLTPCVLGLEEPKRSDLGGMWQPPSWRVAWTFAAPVLNVSVSVCDLCAAAHLEPGHSCERHVESQ